VEDFDDGSDVDDVVVVGVFFLKKENKFPCFKFVLLLEGTFPFLVDDDIVQSYFQGKVE